MDRLFRSDERRFISPPICLRSFLASAGRAEDSIYSLLETSGEEDVRGECSELLQRERHDPAKVEAAINEVDICLEDVLCRTPVMEHYEITRAPVNTRLGTHTALLEILALPDTRAKNLIVGSGKYFKWRADSLKRPYATHLARGEHDVLLTVNALAPRNKTPTPEEAKQHYKHRCEMKLLVRGETLLSDLCDKLSATCPSTLWNGQCVMDGLKADPDFTFGALFKGRLLFVHNTFYTDAAINSPEDLSVPTREFMARREGKGFNRHQVRPMDGVRVVELTLRVGQPYVFIHQGGCEHLVIFSDPRLLNASDEQDASKYPLKVFDNRHETLCFVCDRVLAVYVVTQCERVPMLPSYFCAKCFSEFGLEGRCVAHYYADPMTIVEDADAAGKKGEEQRGSTRGLC